MTYVLGVDGGGTKTHAVLADEHGEVLGAAVDGPSNWEEVGIGRAGAALRVAVAAALETADIAPSAVAVSVFGLAGVDWPSDVERLRFAIDPLGLHGVSDIVNDSMIALRAGVGRPWGIVVIAGTGSVVAGRSPSRDVFRTLGLGPTYGDFGSATDVSAEAVRAVAEAYTGRGPATGLTERLCTHLRCSSAAELLERVSRRSRGGRIDLTFENLAPVVIATAVDGDLVARDILERAGTALGESAVLVARTLDMLDLDFEVVLSGGFVLGAGRFVLDPLEVVVRRAAPRASFVTLDAPPVIGAALMALELLGAIPGPEVRDRLAREAVEAFGDVGT